MRTRKRRGGTKGTSMLFKALLALGLWFFLPQPYLGLLITLVIALWLADRNSIGGMALHRLLERRLNRPVRPVVVQTKDAAPTTTTRTQRRSYRKNGAPPKAVRPQHPAAPALASGEQDILRWLLSLGQPEASAHDALAHTDASLPMEARALQALAYCRALPKP